MRSWTRIPTFFSILSFLLLILAGCGGVGSLDIYRLENISKREVNPSLPSMGTESLRTIVDVGSVGFEWNRLDDLDGVEGFAIALKDRNGQLKTVFVVRDPYATHAYVSKLSSQTEYTFYFFVLGNNNTVSSMGEPITIKTSFIDPIENVFVTHGLPREIKLFWTPHSNPSIRRYIIQRQLENQGRFVNIGVVSPRLMSEFFDTKLEDGKTYRYRIVAESFDGLNSIPSEVIEGKTRDKPDELTGIYASKDEPKQITIKWKVPSNPAYPVTSYAVYGSDNSDKGFKQLSITQSQEFTEVGLKDGQTRFYRVVPIDKDNVTGDMGVSSVMGMSLPLPPRPVISSSGSLGNGAYLEWVIVPKGLDYSSAEGQMAMQKAQRVVSYKVCRMEGKKRNTRVCFENISDMRFFDRDMEKNITYTYEVYSLDKYGLQSLASTQVSLSLAN